MSNLMRWLVVSLWCFTNASAHAGLRYGLGAGFEFGGSEMIRVANSLNQYHLLGGNGILLNFGVSTENAFRLNSVLSIDFQVNLGAKLDAIESGLGKASIVRYPLELLSFARFSKFRLGGGLTYHLGGQFSQESWAQARTRFQMLPSRSTGFFSSGLGFVLQADYAWSESMSLGLRYTAIQYSDSHDLAGDQVRGNSIGLIYQFFI